MHIILIFIIYFGFNPTPSIIEIDRTFNKVAVSFVAKPGNAVSDEAVSNPPKIKPEVISHIQKEQPKPKKLEISKKTKPKQEEKNFKPKTIDAKSEASYIKKSDKKDNVKQKPEKPKFEEKKPEIKEESDLKEEKPTLETNLEQSEIDKDIQDEEESKESQHSFTKNSIESLDLLVREKFNIQTQIKRCYKKALLEGDKHYKATIDVHIFIAQDGFIDLDAAIFRIPPEKVVNGVEDEDFLRAKDTVKKALKFCNPIRNLPQDKYDIWKEVDLRFD